jgi:hypothetical protein
MQLKLTCLVLKFFHLPFNEKFEQPSWNFETWKWLFLVFCLMVTTYDYCFFFSSFMLSLFQVDKCMVPFPTVEGCWLFFFYHSLFQRRHPDPFGSISHGHIFPTSKYEPPFWLKLFTSCPCFFSFLVTTSRFLIRRLTSSLILLFRRKPLVYFNAPR